MIRGTILPGINRLGSLLHSTGEEQVHLVFKPVDRFRSHGVMAFILVYLALFPILVFFLKVLSQCFDGGTAVFVFAVRTEAVDIDGGL